MLVVTLRATRSRLRQDAPSCAVCFGLEGRVSCSAGSTPDRTRPFAFDDDSAAPTVSLGELTVFDTTVPAALSPPALGSLSAERELFRQEARSALQSLFASSAALGKVRTFEAACDSAEGNGKAQFARVTDVIGRRVPCLFTAVVLLGPKSPSPPPGQSAVRCSYVELIKAVVAFWQVVRGMRPVFDAAWYP